MVSRILFQRRLPIIINSRFVTGLNYYFAAINDSGHILMNNFSYTHARNYAESKDTTIIVDQDTHKNKDEGTIKSKINKVKSKGVQIKKTDIRALTAEVPKIIKQEILRFRCNCAIDKMKEDFTKNLSLLSTAGYIESLPVKFEGKDYKLQELAEIIRQNPSSVIMNFTSFPKAIPDALKAVESSGINVSHHQDGNTIYFPLKKMTKEDRNVLAKKARVLYIKCRNSIKAVQDNYIRQVINQTHVTDDLIPEITRQIMLLCEEYQMQARKIYLAKHAEIIGKPSTMVEWNRSPRPKS